MIEEQFNFRVTSRIEFSLLSIVSILLSTIVPPLCLPLTISDPNFHRFPPLLSLFPLSIPSPKFLCFPCVVTLAWMQIHVSTAGLFAREFSPRKGEFLPVYPFPIYFYRLIISRPTFLFFFPNVYQSRLYVLFSKCFFFFFVYSFRNRNQT